jgi:hypothetical protein
VGLSRPPVQVLRQKEAAIHEKMDKRGYDGEPPGGFGAVKRACGSRLTLWVWALQIIKKQGDQEIVRLGRAQTNFAVVRLLQAGLKPSAG